MTARERQVLALIRANPLISQVEIAKRLKISRSAVAGHIMRLNAKGIIRGRGYVFSESPFTIVIGGANMDICGAPANDLVMHDSNPGTVSVSPGGVARNIAENLARLGMDTRLVAAVGADEYGDLLLEQSRAAGIDTSHVFRLDSAPTSTYVSVLDNAGDMLVAINDMSIADSLDADRLQSLEQVMRQARLIVADTNLPESALAYLADNFRAQAIFVDTVSASKATRIRPFLDCVHSIKMSRIEAEAISGTKFAGKRSLPRIAEWFLQRGVQRVFITLGADGVYYSDGSEYGERKAHASNGGVVNAGGAGDAFVAGLAFAWHRDWALAKSVGFAMSAASIALAHRATINPAMSASAVTRRYNEHFAA